MNKHVLLISGKQGSGKDTITDMFTERFSREVFINKLKFAATIYQMHDICKHILKQKRVAVNPDKDGELLQFLGTDWGRMRYGADIWVNCFLADCLNIYNSYANEKNNPTVLIVCSDLRFVNEFHALDHVDDVTVSRVRLECRRDLRMQRATSWRTNEDHISETDLDFYSASQKFDLIINTGELGKYDAATRLSDFMRPRLGLSDATAYV